MNIEHLTKAELYGRVQELEHENEQLKRQIILRDGQNTTLHY